MAEICASLLAANHGYLIRDLKFAEKEGIKRFHLDVCDGDYTEKIIFGDQLIRDFRCETDSLLEVHLAVLNLPAITRTFMESGADIISIQFETARFPSRLIKEIRVAGISPGISIIPATGFHQIEFILEEPDLIKFIAVDPGIGGQEFDPRILRKIEKTAEFIKRQGLITKISVDGGVNLSNLRDVLSAGADIVTIGTDSFQGDITENISEGNRIMN